MNACTIIARNYLAQARVLAESFREHHPDGTFSVLVVDALDRPVSGAREPFDVLTPIDIGLEERQFHRMTMIYDVMELCTAVKPWLLRHLLRPDAGALTYFDPDMELYEPLDALDELTRDHAIVLTPHTSDPFPHDNREPGEVTLLLAGMYNLGFISVGPRAGGFLEWWEERAVSAFQVAPERGQFVDQRWVDFVPVLFEHHILRDPGCNVAWWNLFARDLRLSGTRYEVEGAPLRLFHFSGFDPTQPHLLSKHQGPRPRVLLSERPDLARLCREYGERLLAAGYESSSRLPYGFDVLPGGMQIDRRMRLLYRDAIADAEVEGGPEPPDPFDRNAPEAFVAWLSDSAHPHGSAAKISRYLQRVFDEDFDLQRRFPDIRWVDGDRFLEWVFSTGRHEKHIPAALIPAAGDFRHAGDAEPPRAPREWPAPGINVAGYLRAELGIGEAARQLIAGIRRAGIPLRTIAYARTQHRQNHPVELDVETDAVYDVNLLCINADELPGFTYDVGPGFFENRYSIGVWHWELATFSGFEEAFEPIDEVWATSDFVAKAIAAATDKPVRTIPLPVEVAEAATIPRAELGIPEGFVLLFSFDFLSVFERKNPLGLVEAFKRAFPTPGGAALVLKSINGELELAALEELRVASAGRPDIILMDGYVTVSERDALTAACDCYVSLHRSEGFGLTLAEAMAYGKPVIATAYSGNLTFMNEGNSYLVPYTLGAVPSGCEPYPEGSEWAEPDLDAAAALMRHVLDHRDEASEKGRVAQEEIRANHSPERTGAFIAQRLDEIRNSRPEVPWSEEAEERESEGRSEALEQAAAFLARGPSIPWAAPSRLGPVGQLARRMLLRLLRPYTARQREFESAVVQAMQELERAAAERSEREGAEARGRELALRVLLQRQLERLESLDRRLVTSDAALGPQLTQIVARLAELEDALDARATRGRREPEESPLAR